MKAPRLLFLTALVVVAGGPALAFDPVKGPARTEVVFFEPEKFTDVRDSWAGVSERARDATLDELSAYLVKQANFLLAPGQRLKITITDVALAGNFEPWRGPEWSDVRIVRDIYPPDIKLSFQLTDADGHVLKQGDRNLRDLGFMMRLSIDLSDRLRFEKALIEDWVRDEFRGLKSK